MIYLEDNFEKIEPPLKFDDKGKVFKARDKITGEFVIIKSIENLVGNVYQLLKKNYNPFLPEILYFMEDKANVDTVVVYRFIEGETLDGKILTESDTREILLQLCDVLEFLHALQIVHSDIKPANIIWRKNKKIRLIDFDAARIYNDDRKTQTRYLGTEKYASPEQIKNIGQIDFRSDIYNLGKTFLELLGENYNGKLKKILLKCTETAPENRYQSISELKAALTQKNFTVFKICATVIFILAAGILFYNLTSEKTLTTHVAEILYRANTKEINLSLGGLSLGDSVEKMHAIFGREERITPSEIPNINRYEYKSVVITCNENKICGLVSYTDEIATESGVRQGDSIEKVIEIYGRRCSVIKDGENIFYEYPYEFDDKNFEVIRFAIKSGCVEYISLRTVEEFQERNWILANVRTI